MPRLRIPRPIGAEILPKDGIPLNRLERDPLIRTRLPRLLILTLQKPTPLLPRWHPQSWKIGPAARTVRPEINHERTETVASSRE